MRLRALPFALAAATTVAAAPAGAVEIVDIHGNPLTLDVTNTATLNWHFDNRNDVPQTPSGQLDDHYGEWINRLNVQLNWWNLRLGARFDAVTYASVMTEDETFARAQDSYAELEAAGRAPPSFNTFYTGYQRDLHTRFLNTYYPAKLYLGYTQPGIDATVGDFYVQLGRGLVFSVRKIDELAIDTTVRGGKLVLDHDFDPFRVALTAFGGQMNPVRFEETSGRRLHGAGSPLFFGYPDIGDFSYLAANPVDPNGPLVEAIEPARPNYLEDTVVGGRVEVGIPEVQLAGNLSMVLRRSFTEDYLACESACGATDAACREACLSDFPDFSSNDPAKNHNTIRTFSGSINVPSIAKHGDVYLEIAGQQLREGHLVSLASAGAPEERTPDLSGYAVYGAASVRAGPVTGTLEGKHYRSFFPLSANIDVNDPTFGAPEFNVVSYNNVPTAEPIYVEQIGSPNICMTGGRGRADVRLAKPVSVYGWLGHYVSYTEIDAANVECETDDELRTTTWDAALGVDLQFEGGKSHANAWVGGRLTDRAVASDVGAVGHLTDIFYREGYIRYDLVKHLSGAFALQFQGFHRHRLEPVTEADSWNEGENYTALQWSPHFAFIFGYEYTARSGCERGDQDVRLCHYVNGGLQWKSASTETVIHQLLDTVQLFVGQRRGAVRCVSGVCRQFPPFEGAKIEITSRF